MEFFILGSCVIRDIFRVVDGKFEFNYFARTSLISQMSEPLPLEETQIKLDSKFQRQMVMQDFRKYFFESVKQFNPDIVITDLIDERFDLQKFGNSCVTRSSEFVNGKLDEIFPFERVLRLQEETHVLWERACDQFIERLFNVVPRNKIVLHKAFWATEYLENGESKQFENQNYISRNMVTILETTVNRQFKMLLEEEIIF